MATPSSATGRYSDHCCSLSYEYHAYCSGPHVPKLGQVSVVCMSNGIGLCSKWILIVERSCIDSILRIMAFMNSFAGVFGGGFRF